MQGPVCAAGHNFAARWARIGLAWIKANGAMALKIKNTQLPLRLALLPDLHELPIQAVGAPAVVEIGMALIVLGMAAVDDGGQVGD